jgi:Zn-dependent M28 family amino/carboxypeptidase
MVINPTQTDKLFQDTGHTAAELFALTKSHKPLPRFALRAALRAQTRMIRKPLASANVIAKLEGNDPKLKNEYVIFSAHIDGLGLGEPVKGDSIYNGALDNASGCAVLLDIAAALKKDRTRLHRSVLFVFFTAEEVGIQGSAYFAKHPTVPPKSMVANLNLDIVHAIVPLKEIRVLGLEESDLGDAARRAGASLNIPVDSEAALNPDAFTCCSDQRHFILSGIPALVLKVGFPGEFAPLIEKFRRNVYHTPFDDLTQPVNLETAAKFEEIAQRVLLDVANDPRRPDWKATSFYRRYAAR